METDSIERRYGFYGDVRIDPSMPVLILGGKENSLSLARGLGSIGVEISVSGPADCWGLGSKFCSKRYPIPSRADSKLYWKHLLLGNNPVVTQRQIILPCSDDAIEFLAENETELRQRFVFDGGSAEQRLALLDKQKTLDMAVAAGVGTPNFWPVSRKVDLEEILANCRFPLLIKPYSTFKFAKIFGKKFFIIQSNPDELREKIGQAHANGFDVSVVELIPGADDLLSSYYTYVDDNGECLFHFTKRVFRRYPMNSGGATYHATEWLPETAREGLKFLKATGFRGLGNIEFKRDPRDGKLKIIEVNARFTAAQELTVRAGAPIDLIVYCHLTGQSVPSFDTYASDLRFWYPVKDFLAFWQLRRLGQLSFSGWIKSLRLKRHVSPLFSLSDPKPSLIAASALFRKAVWGRL